MALKRKRSSPSFSSPAFSDASISTTTTDASAIPFFYQQSKPVEPTHQKPTWSWPTYDDASGTRHLNSRTQKRYRSNRPDEQTVYASTISKLYEAQRRHPDASPMHPAQSIQPPAPVQSTYLQKSTLHTFWRIPSAPTNAHAMQIDAAQASRGSPEMRCEDCERPLREDDAMELDGRETACAVCRRHVCDTCAVLGNDRICLGCASSR